MNYYNEIDSVAAEKLRRLIARGLIPPGVVDERDIRDVQPRDLAGFNQHHFFAGFGGWPLAFRLAGIPDTWPAWTGSCPCQPFSAAGVGVGFDDERHLWPSWHWLIEQYQPIRVFGEQVDSPLARDWIDLVSTDMEGSGYRVGSLVFPLASVGAPVARHRRYFVADCVGVARSRSFRWGWIAGRQRREHDGRPAQWEQSERFPQSSRASGALARADRSGLPDGEPGTALGEVRQQTGRALEQLRAPFGSADGRGAVTGFWRNADWIRCRDDRWRPIEPGVEPLVDGISGRVGELRGYGNAISPQQGQAFIEAYLAVLSDEEMGV